MKKLALALALFLPMMFVSCGDDEKDEPTPNPTPSMTFEKPVLNWGATEANIKAKVPTTLQLDEKLCSEDATEGTKTIGYITVDSEDMTGLPYYYYNFIDDAMDSADITVLKAWNADFTAWLEKDYTNYGEMTDEDDGTKYYAFGNAKDMKDATVLVMYLDVENQAKLKNASFFSVADLDAEGKATRAEIMHNLYQKAKQNAARVAATVAL